MQTIRLDIANDMYDKVVRFIENLSKNKVKLYVKKDDKTTDVKKESSLVSFFRNSPLTEEVLLKRDEEVYKTRVEF
jgi:phage gp36-like protein